MEKLPLYTALYMYTFEKTAPDSNISFSLKNYDIFLCMFI